MLEIGDLERTTPMRLEAKDLEMVRTRLNHTHQLYLKRSKEERLKVEEAYKEWKSKSLWHRFWNKEPGSCYYPKWKWYMDKAEEAQILINKINHYSGLGVLILDEREIRFL